MVDKIVELENHKSYVILDESVLSNVKYYYGLKLNEKEEPTDKYLFFEEYEEGGDTFLSPVEDDDMKKVLLTSFSINFLTKVYDEI